MTLTATFIEIGNATATEAFYGDAVDPDDGSVLVSPGATSGRRAFVVDLIAGTRRIRYWIPEGELTKDGDVTYQNGQPAGYPVRITCYPSTTLVKADGTSASAKRWSSQLVVTP
jgi:hypothetical protein